MTSTTEQPKANPWDYKPSTQQQWHEVVSAPLATREMSQQEMKEFRDVLARSYQCTPHEIEIEFEAIKDERDEERNDCIVLKYVMKTLIDDAYSRRLIYRLKIPIPDRVKAGMKVYSQTQPLNALVAVSPDKPREQQMTTINSHSISIPCVRKPAKSNKRT